MNSTQAKIYEFFRERRIRLGDSDESLINCNYVEEGLLDSVGVVDYVLYLENTFDIQLGPDEMSSEQLFSITKTATLVQALQLRRGITRESA